MLIKVYNDNGLVIEKDQVKTLLAEEINGEFSAIQIGDDVFIAYEDSEGNLCVLSITIDPDIIAYKTIVLHSKRKKFTNKVIKMFPYNDSYAILFSTFYNDKNVISIYTNKNGANIFDICDYKKFISTKSKDAIVVLYEKFGQLGYSTIIDYKYSEFKSINTINPIELYELGEQIFLLSKERSFVLLDLKTNMKYILPICFDARPEVYYEENFIYIKYIKFRKEILYKIEDEKIVFQGEKCM